jgi:histone H1/5
MADVKPKKAAPSHPPYAQMIAEAISELKERSGSSVPAITKKIGAQGRACLSDSLRSSCAPAAPAALSGL